MAKMSSWIWAIDMRFVFNIVLITFPRIIRPRSSDMRSRSVRCTANGKLIRAFCSHCTWMRFSSNYARSWLDFREHSTLAICDRNMHSYTIVNREKTNNYSDRATEAISIVCILEIERSGTIPPPLPSMKCGCVSAWSIFYGASRRTLCPCVCVCIVWGRFHTHSIRVDQNYIVIELVLAAEGCRATNAECWHLAIINFPFQWRNRFFCAMK